MLNKVCTICGIEKDAIEFPKGKSSCKNCRMLKAEKIRNFFLGNLRPVAMQGFADNPERPLPGRYLIRKVTEKLVGAEKLSAGRLVKLSFGSNTGSERMWVHVTERIEQNGLIKYVGTLGNTPAMMQELQYRDKVEFGPENIIVIESLEN